jgi:hypothetical protein
MFVREHVLLVPADTQSPVQALIWKPESGEAVQVLVPPEATLVGEQATVPLPPLTEAVTLYVVTGIAGR